MSNKIEVSDFNFYYGEFQALKDLNISFQEKCITALIGPNASGKSTLLSGIAEILTPYAGTMDVRQAPTRERIAFVLQTTKVNEALPITVREVVTMGRYPSLPAFGRLTEHDRTIVDAAMERMSIIDVAHQHLRELSGGQRQRVFVAQGLAQDHDILLLDEPLTGLDITSAQAIDTVIHEEQSHGRTIVMSTHDLAEAHARTVLRCDQEAIAAHLAQTGINRQRNAQRCVVPHRQRPVSEVADILRQA